MGSNAKLKEEIDLLKTLLKDLELELKSKGKN